MTWNHRVFRKLYPAHDYAEYTLRETIYDDTGKVEGWTLDAIAPSSDTVEGLRWVLTKMLEALDKPVLEDT